jgi:hypothetical protein
MKIKRIARVSILCAAVLTDSCLAAADTVAAPWFSHDGTIDLVSSNHQDTAWMDTPAACRKFRIEHNIIPALELMRKDSHYTFCMESSLHLMEFLEARPGLRGEVTQRMKEGRLEFGATYNQPYESTPISPPSGPATGTFNGLHHKGRFYPVTPSTSPNPPLPP